MNPPRDLARLKEFQCARCNECCKQDGFVYLWNDESEKIASYLKLEPFEFVNQYCDLVDRTRLVLKKHPNEHCIFLTEEGCQIHDVKPQQCKDFPFTWRTQKSFSYCQGLKNLYPRASV